MQNVQEFLDEKHNEYVACKHIEKLLYQCRDLMKNGYFMSEHDMNLILRKLSACSKHFGSITDANKRTRYASVILNVAQAHMDIFCSNRRYA